MTGFLLILLFLVMAGLMYSGRMPALVALPLLAVGVTVVAGLPYHYAEAPVAAGDGALERLAHALAATLDTVFGTVFAEGIPRLQRAIFIVLMGGIFGHLLKLSGVAESLVRRVAELAGERAFPVCLLMTLTVAFLFTTLGGLGAVIMVAGIVFPVQLSMGVPPLLVGSLFLMGFSLGGVLNLANWGLYLDTLGLTRDQVAGFALPFAALFLVVLLVFLVVELRRARLKVEAAEAAGLLGAVTLIGGAAGWLWYAGYLDAVFWTRVRWVFATALVLLFLWPVRGKGPGWPGLLAPALPIGLVLLMEWNILAAFAVGILYLLRRAADQDRVRLASRAILEGVESVLPAVCLLMGIGMVFVAVWRQPPVQQALEPLLRQVLPSTPLGYVVGFGLLAPLALYRGPLNIWGMGSGVLGLTHSMGALAPARIMAAFLTTGQIQGVCDPTNTHNVWIANQLQVDAKDILRRTLPWVWAVAVGGLVLATVVVPGRDVTGDREAKAQAASSTPASTPGDATPAASPVPAAPAGAVETAPPTTVTPLEGS